RGAQLSAATLHREPRTDVASIELPAGSDGLIVVTDGDLTGVALSAEARAAGVELTSLGDLLRRDPDRARALLDGGVALPADDRFAQLTRATGSQGVVLAVPAGVRLARPIVFRWVVTAAGRALLSRTVIAL